jgi:hypothetical protein
VFILIVVLLLLFVILALLLGAWALFYQGYIYTESVTGVAWRAPAAAGALMVPVLMWVIFDYRWTGKYGALYDFSASDNRPPYPELRVPQGKRELVYKLMPGTAHQYRLDGKANGAELPARPEKLLAKDGDEELVFERQKESKKARWSLNQAEAPTRYVARDSKGRTREMVEGSLGQVSGFRTGRLIAYVFVNLLLLAAWLAAMWLILRFGWSMALLQAVVFWLATILLIMPPLLKRAEAVAAARAVKSA